MGRLLIALLATVALAGELPKDFVAAGVVHNPYAAPQVNGWASYAKLVTDRRVYLHGTVDVTSATKVPFTVQVSYRAGVATPVLENFGPFTVFLLAEAGMAAAQDNVGGAWSAGGVLVTGIHRGWKLLVPVRVTKTALSDYQASIGIGFGWGR
jgi:carbohydrate-binding DOMON domain-containing protein